MGGTQAWLPAQKDVVSDKNRLKTEITVGIEPEVPPMGPKERPVGKHQQTPPNPSRQEQDLADESSRCAKVFHLLTLAFRPSANRQPSLLPHTQLR
jgi:hypothetical protein